MKQINFLSLCAGSWRDCISDFLNHRLYGCNGLRTWKCDIHTETRGSRDLGLTSPRGYFDVAWQKLWHKNGVFWSLTSSWEKWPPVAVCRVTKISLSMWTFSLYFSFIFLFIFHHLILLFFQDPFLSHNCEFRALPKKKKSRVGLVVVDLPPPPPSIRATSIRHHNNTHNPPSQSQSFKTLEKQYMKRLCV